MRAVVSFAMKALAIGPLPYLGLSAAIIGVGAVLQLRGGAASSFADGSTVFGTFAQIGGCVGLFGLATLALRGLPSEAETYAAEADVPQSARAARMDGADPRPARPARPARPDAAKPAPARSEAARIGMRLVRQFGMRAIRQIATRRG